MEHPILQILRGGCNMKIQKRSESNVLSKLTPIKTEESRGYVNDGTQQLLKPLTFGVRGFHFAQRFHQGHGNQPVHPSKLAAMVCMCSEMFRSWGQYRSQARQPMQAEAFAAVRAVWL